jgi:uncharacterized protein YdeI (YjbR/CyaY-like superfamily)
MPKTDERIDAYIAAAGEFARPIATKIREAVHAGCPDCEETMKWGQPTFVHGGKILCGFGAFKAHVRLHFWKGGLVGQGADPDEWGRLHRLTAVSDLPSKKVLAGYVKKAVAASELVETKPKRTAKPKQPAAIPDDLMAAMRKNKKALAGFEALSPSHKREYVEWITEAKASETRARRIAQTVEWTAQGKSRNWKYM